MRTRESHTQTLGHHEIHKRVQNGMRTRKSKMGRRSRMAPWNMENVRKEGLQVTELGQVRESYLLPDWQKDRVLHMPVILAKSLISPFSLCIPITFRYNRSSPCWRNESLVLATWISSADLTSELGCPDGMDAREYRGRDFGNSSRVSCFGKKFSVNRRQEVGR